MTNPFVGNTLREEPQARSSEQNPFSGNEVKPLTTGERVGAYVTTALGPLARKAIAIRSLGGMVNPTAVEDEMVRRERRLAEESPVASTATAIGGALPRYLLAGGPIGAGVLGAAESLASRPEESVAALIAGQESTLAQNPILRTGTDILAGEALAGAGRGLFRGGKNLYRYFRPLAEEAPVPPRALPPGVYETPGPRELPALPSGERAVPETDPRLLLPETSSAARTAQAYDVPAGPGVATPAGPLRLPRPEFPPESPRFRARTVDEMEAEAAAELAERQAAEAAQLEETIAARQAADAAAQAERQAALEAEPSRFPRPEPPPRPSEVFGPPQAEPGMRTMEESLTALANAQWRRGRQRDAEQLGRRIADLDRLRETSGWDDLSPEQQRTFINFTSYAENRRAAGLAPTVGGEMAEVVSPTGGKARKKFVQAQTRAVRQLRAMEEWGSLSPAEREQVVRAMEQESLMTRMGDLQSRWRQALQGMMNTPLNEVVIINPQTGREVTVASALKRAKNHPARFEAEAYVRELQDEWDALTMGTPSRTPYVGSRIGERPTLRAAEAMPPVPKPLDVRKAERAAGRAGATAEPRLRETAGPEVRTEVPQETSPFAPEMPAPTGPEPRVPVFPETERVRRSQWSQTRPGFATPELVAALARIGGGGLLGSGVGAAFGETPEERLNLALAGALAGAGVGAAGPSIARQAARGLRINEALDDIAKAAKRASKTPGMPGTSRFRTNVGGVLEALGMGSKRGNVPRPGVRMADDVPLSRPTTVLPEEEPVLRRLNLSPEMQDIYGPRIAALAAQKVREPQEKLANDAARLLNTRRETLANLNPKRMTGAEMLAVASMVRENTEEITRLAQSLNTIVDPIQRSGVLEQMDRLDGQTNALMATMMKGRTAQGQALAANRVLANLTSDPSFWFLKAQRVKGDDVLTQVEKANITDLLNKGPGARDQLVSYLAGLRRSSMGEQIAQLRRAGLLTTIAGRVRDVIGTGTNLVVKPILRIPGALADSVAANLVSKQVGGKGGAAYRSMLEPDMAEWSRMASGLRSGWNEMLEALGSDAIRKGDFKTLSEFVRAVEVDPALLARYDIPGQVNITMFENLPGGARINELADFYQKYIMRLSGGTDRIFRAAAYKGAMQEQARLVAMREGLTGQALTKRVTDLLANAPDELTANAQMLAEYATFTNDGTLARILSTITEGAARVAERSPVIGGSAKLGSVVRTGMNLLVPFRRTPANLISRVIEFTPGVGTAMAVKRATNWWGEVGKLALESATEAGMSAAQRQAVQTSQRKMVETLTANATGLGMIALGTYLYEQGVLTGESPRTGAEAEQWRTEGRQPNSILIGGQWYPVGQIAPLGNILSIAANFKQNAETGMTAADKAGSFAIDAMRTTLNQPLLTGPREALEALTTDRDVSRENYARQFAGSFIPGGVAALARAGGVQREPMSAMESMASRIPGLAGTVPARLDVFGQPVQKAEGLLMPTTPDVRQRDPVVWEMSNVGAKVGRLSQWDGEPPAQYRFRQEQSGQWLRADLEALVGSEYYQTSTPKEQRELIEQVAEKSRRDVTAFLRDTYGIERP